VVGEASDGDEAVEEWKRLQPDVTTMDIVMPRRSGIDAVKGSWASTRRVRRDVQRAGSGDARAGGAPGGRARLHREAVQARLRDRHAEQGAREAGSLRPLDLAKYRTIFIEESTEHFAEISRALLELEKEPGRVEAIDVVFRMAHSIKGMAASLGYDSITELAHKLEDRMQLVREAGAIEPRDELAVLFRGLAALEAMVGSVRETGSAPPVDPALVSALAARSRVRARRQKKKS
jgi:HPt (histidine-containing phosphotransfer) domain-containing protein